MNRSLFISLITIVLIAVSGTANAQPLDDLRSQADEVWAKRDSLEKAQKAVDLFEQIAKQDPDDIEARVMLARATYWVAEQEPEQIKEKQILEILMRGINACNQVLAKDPDHVGARYWLMRNMAAKNTLESIFDFDLNLAVVGTIYISKGDVNYHFGGVYRYWGEVIYTIPGLLGKFFNFTIENEIWLLKQSVDLDPRFLKARYLLARSYVKKKDEDRARIELNKIIKASPDDLPGYEPENRFYQKLAREMLEDL